MFIYEATWTERAEQGPSEFCRQWCASDAEAVKAIKSADRDNVTVTDRDITKHQLNKAALIDLLNRVAP